MTPPTGSPSSAPAPTPTPAPATTQTTPTTPVDAPATNVAEARRRYAQGAEFYRRGRFSEAVAELTEAYSLWSNPTILYALAQAFEGLSDVNRAIETYERYLASAPLDDVRRADVTAKIAELRGLLATVRIDVNVAASVYVDGDARGDAPGEFRIATGRHEIEVRAEGFESRSQTITIAGGTERTLAFELRAVAVTAQLVQVERSRFRFPRPVFYTGVALTGAGLVTWASMASIAVVRANEYNDTPGSTNFERADARRRARDSNVALAVTGGLAASTAIIGLLTRWRDPEDASDGTRVSASIEPVVGGAIMGARWTR